MSLFKTSYQHRRYGANYIRDINLKVLQKACLHRSCHERRGVVHLLQMLSLENANKMGKTGMCVKLKVVKRI